MKKFLFLVAVVALAAAACNPGSQTTSQSRIDAAVSDLNASVDSETATDLQSDDSIINSDQNVISDYQGAVNENSY